MQSITNFMIRKYNSVYTPISLRQAHEGTQLGPGITCHPPAAARSFCVVGIAICYVEYRPTKFIFTREKPDIEFALGIRDLDLALREDEPFSLTEPPKPTGGSSNEQTAKYDKWEMSNRLSMLTMKRVMSYIVPGGIPSCDNAKKFLNTIEQNVRESKKAETGNLLSRLNLSRVDMMMSSTYDGNVIVREHILMMLDMAYKLKYLDISIPDSCSIHIALNSISPRFGQLKTAYKVIMRKNKGVQKKKNSKHQTVN
ncbi:hypothetical protein DVH24_025592 [Malus domestica]|uniref:UBN2 domain-containing protein n=1 Tax=Malus domestica TaxID=3750 RepID=A0A498HSG4_MALDO|nr:hypothetical protein DVH24_025592 [Malus domestica]